MTLGRRTLLATLLASPAATQAQETPAALRELARRATIYLFPLYEMYRARWQATVDDANPQRQKLNRFRHMPELADPRTRKGFVVSLIKASSDDEPGDPEFRRPNILWQTPPRPDLKPGRSTPFSRPDWDQHPVLRQGFDPPAVSHDPSS